jgi:hypothetical protein
VAYERVKPTYLFITLCGTSTCSNKFGEFHVSYEECKVDDLAVFTDTNNANLLDN